ncbi:MAG: hypothetical protein ACK4ON_14415, partial [Bacteroidia bacterium]
MLKPHHILIFIASVLLMLGAIMLVFPSNGFMLGNYATLKFPEFQKFFFDEKPQYADISNIIAAADSSLLSDNDSLITKDEKPGKQYLQFPPENNHVLDNFFKKLESSKFENRLVHILHIGDSQIEGDRISAFLRNKLQQKFG